MAHKTHKQPGKAAPRLWGHADGAARATAPERMPTESKGGRPPGPTKRRLNLYVRTSTIKAAKDAVAGEPGGVSEYVDRLIRRDLKLLAR